MSYNVKLGKLIKNKNLPTSEFVIWQKIICGHSYDIKYEKFLFYDNVEALNKYRELNKVSSETEVSITYFDDMSKEYEVFLDGKNLSDNIGNCRE